VIDLRRSLGAQRDVFQKLSRSRYPLQQQTWTLYYRTCTTTSVRQYETVDSLRDLLTSAMDVYLSTVSNRLNQTTKALTVIASLFCHLSFLTGFLHELRLSDHGPRAALHRFCDRVTHADRDRHSDLPVQARRSIVVTNDQISRRLNSRSECQIAISMVATPIANAM